MIRVTNSVSRRKKNKKILKAVSGYSMRRSRTLRCAKEALRHAQEDKTVSRHLIKRTARRLWIIRLNSFARQNNIPYNILLNEINSNSPFKFNRKILAHLVYFSPEIVQKILDKSIYVNI